MNKDPSIHTALLGLDQFAIEMKDRIDDQDLGMLLMYDQDVLNLLVFAVKKMIAVLTLVCRSHREVLKYLY